MIHRISSLACCFLVLTCLGFFPAPAHGEEPVPVTVCQLLADPPHYNHILVEITGDISHGFEDFTLSDGHCDHSNLTPSVWLEYGGTVGSGTIYACSMGGERKRPSTLVVDGIATYIKEDALFQSFDRIMQHQPRAAARATVIGRYFAGIHQHFPNGLEQWGGFGHLCLSTLLIVEQVLVVDEAAVQD